MNLQYALLLIGLVIIAVVALTAYDMSRLRRPRSRPTTPPHLGNFPDDESAVRASHLHATREADSDMVLRADLDLTPREKPRDQMRQQEIRQLEEVATMPLNLATRWRPDRRDVERGKQSLFDEKIDFVVQLPGDVPVSRDVALAVFKQHEYKLNKARHLYGRRHGTAHWSDLQRDRASTQYDDLMLAIQLVDPRGPVDESELTTFTDIGLRLADTLQRPTRLPRTFEEGLARAKELQAFSDTYDVIAGIQVVPENGSSFSGRAIQQAARDAGLELGAMNLFHRKNDVAPGSRHLFSMANLAQTGAFDPASWDHFESSGLALFLSVPSVFQPGVVFERMVTTARGMAAALGGRLQDQNRRPLTDKGIAVIQQQIEEIEEKMRAFGITPGGETALKLFKEATSP